MPALYSHRFNTMRARSIKPGICTNELLGVADPFCTLLFERLWMLADREGRLKDIPLRIKGQAFPYSDVNVEVLLCWLALNAFIVRYEANGEKYIQINEFSKHQHPHVKEAPSTIPAPGKHSAGTRKAKGKKRSRPAAVPEIPALARLTPSSLTPDSGLLTPDSNTSTLPRASGSAESMDIEVDPPGLDVAAAARFIAYRKTRKPAIRPESMAAFKRQLARHGDQQAAVVEHSIANSYQGLIEPKINGGAHQSPALRLRTPEEIRAEEDARDAQH
jgi:hypothetical protein